MNSRGGSRLMEEQLKARMDFTPFELVLMDSNRAKRGSVLWQQHNTDQPDAQMMKDKDFQDKIRAFVFVSNWQYMKYRKEFRVPPQKSFIIKNAIEPIPKHSKPPGMRLIYTSTPWRGLEVLLRAIPLLKNKVQLSVYSSTKIYGDEFYKENDRFYQHIYRLADGLENVEMKGFAPNEVIREELKGSHILAYPSTWEETSCISAIEALSAGCKVVTTNLGALPETCGEFARYVPSGPIDGLVHRYARALDEEIENYQGYDHYQAEFYKNFYSWDVRLPEWQKLKEEL